MKIWKVIFATLVIFSAGVLAGGILFKTLTPSPRPPLPDYLAQQFFQARLKKELELSMDQTQRIDRIFFESRERRKVLYDLISPEMQKELQEVRDNIRAVLTPPQQDKFEQLLKQPPHRPDGPRRSRSGTNATNSARMMPANMPPVDR